MQTDAFRHGYAEGSDGRHEGQARMGEPEDDGQKWVVWLLIAAIPLPFVAAFSSTNSILAGFYGAIGVVTTGLLAAVMTHRMTSQQAFRGLLLVALSVLVAGTAIIFSDPVDPGDASSYMVRILVIVIALGFLALEPTAGLALGLVCISGGMVALLAVDVPLLRTGRLQPGLVETTGLLLVVLAMVRALAVSAARSEETAEAAAESAELAYRDDLTGLPNRRQMTMHIEQALHRAGPAGDTDSPSDALVMFDLDHFKAVNDTLGHTVGDEVLQRTAALSAAAVREGDYVGRWGGEEFVALLVGADRDHAVAVAERCRRTLETASHGLAVTASFGVTTLADGDSVDSALRRVDLALYDAKEQGRNRVIVRPPLTSHQQ